MHLQAQSWLPGSRSFAQDLPEPHELDKPTELRRGAPQSHPTAVAPHGELESRERVDGYRVYAGLANVADGHARATTFHEGAHTPAQPREVCALDRAADGKNDRGQPDPQVAGL